MSVDLWQAQTADLAALGARARLRRLAPRTGLDFSSNDYLGLSGSDRLRAALADALARGVAVGSGGSRLLRGNDPEHELLEAEAAAFFGCESALWFGAGYAANVALISALPQRDDLIIYDELIHASVHEGLRLTRAQTAMAAHSDVDAFDDIARRWRAAGHMGRIWLAVESLYSMDGDRAPLDDLAQVAQRHGGILMIDEAHATGVFGPQGRGLAAHLDGRPDVVCLRTCGKALGAEGALVCAPRVVTDFLVNRGRPFIFSTAPSPLMASAVRAALRLCAEEPERREALAALVAHAQARLGPLGATISGSQIMPLIVGEDARTMALAARVQEAGFDVRGIRPPTVPAGTSRLRISLTLHVTPAQVDALAAVLAEALCKETGAKETRA